MMATWKRMTRNAVKNGRGVRGLMVLGLVWVFGYSRLLSHWEPANYGKRLSGSALVRYPSPKVTTTRKQRKDPW
jgi:hypothetical protein